MTASVSPGPTHKPRPLIDLMVSIVIPSVILMKFSSKQDLGSLNALLLALAFPIAWGLFELFRYRKKNIIVLLGLLSVLLTGSISLFELDASYLAIKEAVIPAIIGVAIVVSTHTRYPLVRTLIYNPKLLNTDKIHARLEENNATEEFENRLRNASYFFAGIFFFTAVMNYLLAIWIVVSPAGTQAFNEELGRMTIINYPLVTIPSFAMMALIFYYLWRAIRRLTGYTLEELRVKK